MVHSVVVAALVEGCRSRKFNQQVAGEGCRQVAAAGCR